MRTLGFTKKESARAMKFFSKFPQQPAVCSPIHEDNYTIKSAPIRVKVVNRTIKIYRNNRKIFQFTNSKLSELYVSIHPQNNFVAFAGSFMQTDISHLYLVDVRQKKIVYKNTKAFQTFEWHKNKLLIAGRAAQDFTQAYGPGVITEVDLGTITERDVYASPEGVIVYLSKFKQQLYINELKTQFDSYYLLSDEYEKSQILDLHHQGRQSLFTTKNYAWRIKHTSRNPFGKLQRIDFQEHKITKTINFKGWVNLNYVSDALTDTFVLAQMNTKGEIRVISLNQNGTVKGTHILPLGTAIENMNYHQGRFYVYYECLGQEGKLTVQAQSGRITQTSEPENKKLSELTVTLKKYKNSWIYIYQLGDQPLVKRPTLIYTYGGFGVEPGFNVKEYYGFLKKGGVIAEVCPRGGIQEVFRYRWNSSRGHKEKTIKDVISATKYLIQSGISQKGQIGLTGASNGGFVVGAVLNRAPSLYQAVLSEVGVMDLANYEQYTGGDVWSCEYGTTKSKLKKLSPVENIKDKQYPVVYVVSGQYDTRVAPIHQIKYTKALKAHGHQVLFQSFPEGHSIQSRTLTQNTVKFFTYFLISD
jgi:predicted esterase